MPQRFGRDLALARWRVSTVSPRPLLTATSSRRCPPGCRASSPPPSSPSPPRSSPEQRLGRRRALLRALGHRRRGHEGGAQQRRHGRDQERIDPRRRPREGHAHGRPDRRGVARRGAPCWAAGTATTAQAAAEAQHAASATRAERATSAERAASADRATTADRAVKAEDATHPRWPPVQRLRGRRRGVPDRRGPRRRRITHARRARRPANRRALHDRRRHHLRRHGDVLTVLLESSADGASFTAPRGELDGSSGNALGPSTPEGKRTAIQQTANSGVKVVRVPSTPVSATSAGARRSSSAQAVRSASPSTSTARPARSVRRHGVGAPLNTAQRRVADGP